MTRAISIANTNSPRLWLLPVGLSFGLALTAMPLAAQTLKLSNTSGGGERQPIVSSDGSTVVYGAVINGVREVLTVPIDGGPAVQMTSGAHVRFGYGRFQSYPSLSCTSDAAKICYWNDTGVHIFDVAAKSDTVLVKDNRIPFPQIDSAGQQVAYQGVVAGAMEVFVVPAGGGNAKQITQNSGAGSRFPSIQGTSVVYQKRVAGFHELFLHDLTASKSTQITQNSGPGNRYGRFSPDGSTIAYEAVLAGAKEVFVYTLATNKSLRVSGSNVIGDRLPALTNDAQVFFEERVADLEVRRVDTDAKGLVWITANSLGGLRRPQTDEHGHVMVFQAADATGGMEVWRHRFCAEATWSRYGQHGKPSTGALSSTTDWWRCDLQVGIGTALQRGTPCIWVLGFAQQNIPVSGIPGNWLYTTPAVLLASALDANGAGQIPLTVPPSLKGTLYYQWLLFDPPANSVGLVFSEGTKLVF